jgi:hypothetical protein
METEKIIVLCLSLIILNGGILFFIGRSLGKIDIREAVREKSPLTRLSSAPLGVARDGVAAPVSGDSTSYSRVAGLIGATVMACFLWAVGNAIIMYAVDDPTKLSNLVSPLGGYIAAGATLFAPYAANKLSGMFK